MRNPVRKGACIIQNQFIYLLCGLNNSNLPLKPTPDFLDQPNTNSLEVPTGIYELSLRQS
jgi:hypothetical protein